MRRGSESGIESGCDRDTEQRGKVHIGHMERERGRRHVHKRRDSEEETERERESGGGAAICKAKKSNINEEVTNFSKEARTWAEFSTLELAVRMACTHVAIEQST